MKKAIRTADLTYEQLRSGDFPECDGVSPSPCLRCFHLVKVGNMTTFEGWTCAAFPEGIPTSIVRAENEDHVGMQPGDNGYRYQPELVKYRSGWWAWDWHGIPYQARDADGQPVEPADEPAADAS